MSDLLFKETGFVATKPCFTPEQHAAWNDPEKKRAYLEQLNRVAVTPPTNQFVGSRPIGEMPVADTVAVVKANYVPQQKNWTENPNLANSKFWPDNTIVTTVAAQASPHFSRDIKESINRRGSSEKIVGTPWMADACEVAGRFRAPDRPASLPPDVNSGSTMVVRERFSYQGIRNVLGCLLEHDLHAKRVNSLCDATLGVLHSGSLAICAIGQGLAAARSLKPKHATKQVDRLLSNAAINVDDILVRWVPFVVGARSSIMVAMDWTDFDADNQATIMLALISDHGRSTPLVWLTVDKSTLKDHRNFYEHRVLVRLAELLPAGIKVCIVADRAFGDQKLYRMLTEELYFDYIIRFRGNITVTSTAGETRTAAEWVQAGGRARVLRGAEVTADRYRVGTVVCVQDPEMKQAWCLAASSADTNAKQLTGYYGRRWAIECSLRDSKDLRFGMGLGTIRVKSPERRDRLWLINAFAVVLLTLLGAAGEALGYDRMLKTNTAKRRVHSLFRQGCMLYDLIPTMRDDWLGPLMQRFSQMLDEQPLFADVFGPV